MNRLLPKKPATGIAEEKPIIHGGTRVTCKNGHAVIAPWFIPVGQTISIHKIGEIFSRGEDCVKCPVCDDIIDLLPPLAIRT